MEKVEVLAFVFILHWNNREIALCFVSAKDQKHPKTESCSALDRALNWHIFFYCIQQNKEWNLDLPESRLVNSLVDKILF